MSIDWNEVATEAKSRVLIRRAIRIRYPHLDLSFLNEMSYTELIKFLDDPQLPIHVTAGVL